jgi:hypothetical protein
MKRQQSSKLMVEEDREKGLYETIAQITNSWSLLLFIQILRPHSVSALWGCVFRMKSSSVSRFLVLQPVVYQATGPLYSYFNIRRFFWSLAYFIWIWSAPLHMLS